MRFFQRNKVEFETAVPHQPDIGPLSRQIAQAFSRQEIRDICFDLAIDPDEMPEKAKTEQCSWLIENLQRAGRLPELLSLLQKKRPQFDWQRPIVPTPRDLRNRDNLLQNVKTTWIEGFLQKSLSQAITIELNLSYQPEATARKSLYTTGQSSDLMADHDLMAVFHKYGRSLLILGEPGSGKTITMLQLAEALIAIAQDDPSQPVPVILNLSSWAQQKQPLQEWLVEELFLQYGMSRKLSRTWISQNLLLYLLDGLDEVAAEARDACVQAINYFKAAHPAELVVCSRLADYEQLQEKLNVATAVRLHLLTDDQIQTYLSHPELELTAVRDALATDPNLNELAHSPLFLNIMTLAYRGFTREQLQSFGSLANRRKHLFDTYVDEMFKRRFFMSNNTSVNDSEFRKNQILLWLSNLALNMAKQKQTVFFIEDLEPSWLSNNSYLYVFSSSIVSGLLFGLILWLLGNNVYVFMLGVIAGIVFRLVLSKDDLNILPQSQSGFFSTHLLDFMQKLSLFHWGVIFGSIVGLIFGAFSNLALGLLLGVSSGLLLQLSIWLIFYLSKNNTNGFSSFSRITKVKIAPPGWRNALTKISKNTIIGLVFGIAYAVTLFSVPFFIWYGGVQAPTAPPSIEYLLPLANHRSLRSSLPEVLDISTVLSHSLPIMMLISVVFGLTGSVAGLFSAFLQTVEVDQIIKPGELIRGEAPLNREGLTPTFNQQ